MTRPYMQAMGFKKMPIAHAIELLKELRTSFEFATITVSNKPYKQWLKEQEALQREQAQCTTDGSQRDS